MYESKEERDTLFSFTGKYTEVELLNKKPTGFGWAVLVRDNLESNHPKVIKLPNRDDATRELLSEGEILSKIRLFLRHPNLVQLFAVERYVITWNNQKEDRYFVVMEFGGKDLRKRLGHLGIRRGEPKDEYVYTNGRPLPVDEVLHLGLQITDGLRALHDFEESPGTHIIHRDIKPENILVDDKGVARLTDFGISKVVERLTQNVTVAGTLPYLAPEYSFGRITSASDIYSLGIVLYEMATGCFPFRYHDERFMQMPEAPHLVNPAVPPALSEVILRAMWWDPVAGIKGGENNRYKRAADMLADLRRCFSRMYPVPPQFVRVEGAGPANLYMDKTAGRQVRIFMYETKQPGYCLGRLRTVRTDNPRVSAPLEAFESEEMIGVVVPAPKGMAPVVLPSVQSAATTESVHAPPSTRHSPPPQKHTPLPLPTKLAGQDIYPFLEQVTVLCRQLEALHRLGIYHGFLNPYSLHWESDGWLIDHVWLGATVALAEKDSVFDAHQEMLGFLAPETLGWAAPPTLRTDIYGIGAFMYGRLTKQAPLDAKAALAYSHGQPAPSFQAAATMREVAPDVSRRLQGILAKAMHADPAQRYVSLDQLTQELRGCVWPDDVVATLVEDAMDYQRKALLVEAYDTLDYAQKLAPGHESIHHARAEIFFLEGEFKHALRENAKALNIQATPSICFLHGQCLFALGRFDEALDCYQEGLRMKDCSLGRHLLGQCLEKIGQVKEAVSEWQIGLKMARDVERDYKIAEVIELNISRLTPKP